jgi:hypothetical protein
LREAVLRTQDGINPVFVGMGRALCRLVSASPQEFAALDHALRGVEPQ